MSTIWTYQCRNCNETERYGLRVLQSVSDVSLAIDCGFCGCRRTQCLVEMRAVVCDDAHVSAHL